MRTIFFPLALLACNSGSVELSGTIFDGPGSANTAGGATLSVLDPDGGELAATQADDAGAFSVKIEPSINVFAVVTREGWRPTTFPGVVGAGDEEVPDGTLYGYPEADAVDIEVAFADCPGGDGQGLVIGEVRHFDLVDENGEEAINLASRVSLLLEGGGTQAACYYDNDGLGYSPDALLNGPSGGFVLPDVPAGAHLLEIVYNVTVDVSETQTYPVLVGENGTLSPWFPAWVTLPQG